MKIRIGSLLLTAVAAGVGLVTLLGYFVDNPALIGLRLLFVSWASILAAVAVWIGVGNLLSVHTRRTVAGAPGWPYSLFTVLTLVGVVGVGVLAPALHLGSGPANEASAWIFRHVETAVGASLSGLLAFFLVFAGYRVLRRPLSVTLVAFVVSAVIALAGMAPQPAGLPDLGLHNLWLWLSQVPAVAGARGLLLGIGLGVVATGLRILLAVDRPYGE